MVSPHRQIRLAVTLRQWGADGLRKHFILRLREGESFGRICESFHLPYNLTAEALGWSYQKKRFIEPSQPPAPPACTVLEFSRPPETEGVI